VSRKTFTICCGVTICRTANRDALSLRHNVAPYKFLKAHPGGVKFKSPPGWVDLRGVPDPTQNQKLLDPPPPFFYKRYLIVFPLEYDLDISLQ